MPSRHARSCDVLLVHPSCRGFQHDRSSSLLDLGRGFLSHFAVADRYNVSKRAVTNLAKREDWQRRLLDIEAKAREHSVLFPKAFGTRGLPSSYTHSVTCGIRIDRPRTAAM